MYNWNTKQINEIAKTISNAVTSKIIGESYSKWNSTNSYYPTIIFIMKELGPDTNIRRAQIKLRYVKKADEIDEKDIELLTEKASSLSNFQYVYGTLRVNFVSKDKNSKTTIFVSKKEEAIKLLNAFCDLCQIKWDESDLTFTQGAKRLPITRRSNPLGDYQIDIEDYNTEFTIQIHRIALLINGLEKPIILYDQE